MGTSKYNLTVEELVIRRITDHKYCFERYKDLDDTSIEKDLKSKIAHNIMDLYDSLIKKYHYEPCEDRYCDTHNLMK